MTAITPKIPPRIEPTSAPTLSLSRPGAAEGDAEEVESEDDESLDEAVRVEVENVEILMEEIEEARLWDIVVGTVVVEVGIEEAAVIATKRALYGRVAFWPLWPTKLTFWPDASSRISLMYRAPVASIIFMMLTDESVTTIAKETRLS